MTAISNPTTTSAVGALRRTRSATSAPFLTQVSMMMWRTLITNIRVPAVILPPLIISVFFLFVYEASLSGAANFFLRGQSYLGFILPLSVVSAALSGAGVAGQSIVRDIENGYFDKLMLTPVSRVAVVLGPMVAGAILLGVQTSLLIVIALVMGLEPATGLPGILGVLGFSMLLGLAFSGFTIGVALRSGSAGATQGAGFLFFPLSFLTATFVPLSLLTGWIKVAATYNPITYILEAMRGIINTGWDTEILLRGLGAIALMAVVLYAFAFSSLKARTKRK
ncbi:MAG: ABC transporter permease [Chloroflexi bacterium]|uniref:ABC transporter permease n=1 Tax=Candidatus Flexifilum breve TaxID=3140694 RepID=UPI003134BD89|nr:ABC transporter permease [Chloroflexota bacterium]MBK9749563.1 ABC transporter permease [Chloroflexota bacterium]